MCVCVLLKFSDFWGELSKSHHCLYSIREIKKNSFYTLDYFKNSASSVLSHVVTDFQGRDVKKFSSHAEKVPS